MMITVSREASPSQPWTPLLFWTMSGGTIYIHGVGDSVLWGLFEVAGLLNASRESARM